ncbi:MAG: hypothetical protein ACK5KQ_00950 [Anaerorhabdus sp.]
MKKNIRMLVLCTIIVSIFYVNVSFGGLKDINVGILGQTLFKSVFSDYEMQSFGFEIKPEDQEYLIDTLLEEINDNQLVISTTKDFGPHDNRYRHFYLSAHPKYNKILDFYMPYKAFQKPNFQGSYVLDDKNSTLHKPFFIFDHNIDIKSFDHIKTDDLFILRYFFVYGEKEDIDKFAEDISERIDNLNLEYSEPFNGTYSIIKYLYLYNKVSIIMMWASFLLMVYFTMNLIIEYSDEISIRKLLGQSDLHITLNITKNIAKYTISTALIVCLIINILFVRSLNFMLWGILLMELVLILLLLFQILLCSIFIYLYVKRSAINQIVKSSLNFIKSFNFYQVVKIIILILMIFQVGPSVYFNIENISDLIELHKDKNEMYKVSSITGYYDEIEIVGPRAFQKYLEEYYLKSNDDNIHALNVLYSTSKDGKRRYPVIYLDNKTAKYYGYDYDNDEQTVIINEKIYKDIDVSYYFDDEKIITTKENYRFNPLVFNYYDGSYLNPIIKINVEYASYDYYVIEDKAGSVEKLQSIVEGFSEEFSEEYYKYIVIDSQKELVSNKYRSVLRYFLRFMFEVICLVLIIIYSSFSLVQLYFNAFKKKLSVMWTLGKSNFELCKYLIYTDVLIYIIVWMIIVNFYNKGPYYVDVMYYNVICSVALISSIILSSLLLIRMIRKEVTRNIK